MVSGMVPGARFIRIVLVICAGIFLVGTPAYTQPRDVDCADFSSQSIAQDELNRAPDDPFRLDPDGDGVACEGLPSPSQAVSYVLIGLVLVGGLSYVLLVRQRRRFPENGEQSLERRVTGLSLNLQEAVRVIEEIEHEIQARQRLLDRLKKDANQAEALSKLHATEVEAVAQALQGQLSGLARRSLRGNVILGLGFYALGVVSSILVNLFVP